MVSTRLLPSHLVIIYVRTVFVHVYIHVCVRSKQHTNTVSLFTPPSPSLWHPYPHLPSHVPISPPTSSSTSPSTSSPTSLLLPFSYGEALQALADSAAWNETVDKELRLVSSVKMYVLSPETLCSQFKHMHNCPPCMVGPGSDLNHSWQSFINWVPNIHSKHPTPIRHRLASNFSIIFRW